MSLLSKLFGGSASTPNTEPEEYEGYTIAPEPIKEGGSFRVGARIEKEIGGEVKTHRMIRADTFESADAASEASLAKAKSLIDQQGERIFD